MSKAKKVPNKKYGNQKLSECIEKMHLDSETADVYFEVIGDEGSVERVPAHKFPLAAVSDVFKAMFYGQLKEEGDVKLTDVTAEALKEFLQFFYMREVEPTMENIAEVMHFGHKYDVARCVDVCGEFLKENITNDSICTGLGLALLYDHKELIKSCEKRIALNTNSLFKSTAFLECDKRILEHILKMNVLSCSENKMFEACMSWIKAKSGKNVVNKELIQQHLGDLFYEIRFSSMTIIDFLSLSLSHEYAFSPDEYKDIIQTFTPTGTLPKLFNGNPRLIQWNKDAIVRCGRISPNEYLSHSYYSLLAKTHEKTTFSTNEPLLLGSFICSKIVVDEKNNFHNLKSSLSVGVVIFEASTVETEFKTDTKVLISFTAELCSGQTEVLLPEPILTKPGFFYRISIGEFPKCHYYSSRALVRDVQIKPDINIKFYNDFESYRQVVALIQVLNFNRN